MPIARCYLAVDHFQIPSIPQPQGVEPVVKTWDLWICSPLMSQVRNLLGAINTNGAAHTGLFPGFNRLPTSGR